MDEHDQVLVTGFQINGIPEMQHRDGVMSTKSDATFTSVGCGYGSCKLKTFAVTADGTLCSFGASCIMERLVSLEATSGKVISVTESYVVVGASSGVARLFDPATLEYRATMPFPPAMGAANESLHHADTSTLHPDRSHRYPATIGVRLTGLHAIVLYSDRSMFVYSVADLDNIQVYRSFLFHSGGIRDLKIAGRAKGVTSRGKIIYYNDPQLVIAKGNHMVPNGTFVTCADDNTLRFWHLDLHKTSATKTSRFSGDDAVDFTSNASDRGPWKHPLSQEMLRLVYHDNEADFRNEDSVVLGATCSSFDTIDIHSPSVDTISANGLRVVAIHPDQTEVAVGDKEGKITVLNVPSGEHVVEIPAHSAEVHCIAYAISDSYNQSVPSTQRHVLMASGARDRLIHMYNCSTDRTVLNTLENHSGAVTALHFTHDGNKLLSCGADKSIVFAEIHEGNKVNLYNSLSMMGGKIFDMALSSDDKFMITSCNNRLDIHHISTCNHIRTHHVGEQHHIAICPANYCVAMSGSLSDKTIRVVDITTGDTLVDASGHGELVTSIQFTPDCRRLVSTSSDGCIFVWRLSEDIQRTIKSRLPRLSEMHNPYPEPPTKSVACGDNNYQLLPPPPPSAPVSRFVGSSANGTVNACNNDQSAKRDIKTTSRSSTTHSSDPRTAVKNEIASELQGRWKGKATAVPGPMAKIPMEDWMRTRATAKKTICVGTIRDEELFVSTELMIDRSQTPDWAKTVKPPKKSSPSSEESEQRVVGGKWRSRAEEKANRNENLLTNKSVSSNDNRPHDEEIKYDLEDHFNSEDDGLRTQQPEADENISTKSITDVNGKCCDVLSGGLLTLSVGNMDFQLNHSAESPGSLASEREHLEKRKKQIQTANAVATMNLKLSQLGLIKPTNGKLSDIIEREHDNTIPSLVDEHGINQTGSSQNMDKMKVSEVRNDAGSAPALHISNTETKQSDIRADIPLEMFESIEGPLQIRASKASCHVDESLSTFTHGFMADNSGDSSPIVKQEDRSNGKCFDHVDQSLSSFSKGHLVSRLADNSNLGIFKPATECEFVSVIPNLMDKHSRNQIGYMHDMTKTVSSSIANDLACDFNSDALQERREANTPGEISPEMLESRREGLHHVKIWSQNENSIHVPSELCKDDQVNVVHNVQVDQSLSAFSNGYLELKAVSHAIAERDAVDMSMSAFTAGYGVPNPSKDSIMIPSECAASLSAFTGGFQTHECSTPSKRYQSVNYPHADDDFPALFSSSMPTTLELIPPSAIASSLSIFTSGFNSDEQKQTCGTSAVALLGESNDVVNTDQGLDPKKSLSSFTLGYSAATTLEPIINNAALPVATTWIADAAVIAAFPDNPGKQKRACTSVLRVAIELIHLVMINPHY